MARVQKEFRRWDIEHGGEVDPEVFQREILPGLQSVSLGAMARATGLSEGYCSFIRRRVKALHRRHWSILSQLATTIPSVVAFSLDGAELWRLTINPYAEAWDIGLEIHEPIVVVDGMVYLAGQADRYGVYVVALAG